MTGGGDPSLVVRSATPVVRLLLAAVLTASIVRNVAHAQDLEPRSYTNTPIGLNFLLTGYAYQTGDVATDPSLPLEDAKLHVHSTFLAYARSFELFGTSAKADVNVPYSWLEGTASFFSWSALGAICATASVLASTNVTAAPAARPMQRLSAVILVLFFMVELLLLWW